MVINTVEKRIRELFRWIIPIALFGIGMWTFPIALLGPDRSLIPGDLGDARFNNYVLEHYHAYATGEVDEYWNAPFMYPWKNVLAHSDNLLGTAPIYSAFRHGGFNRESAFQLWVLVLFALNFWCCFFALKTFIDRMVLAACGAFIFAFGIFSIGQIEHAQVFPRFMIPIAFVLTWQLLTTRRRALLPLVALAIIYQFYCGIYLGFLLLYSLFFLVVAYMFVFREWERFRIVRHWLLVLGTMAVSALLMAPLMLPYLEVSSIMGLRDFQDVLPSIPRPVSYFFAHPSALSWHVLSRHALWAIPQWWDHYLFVGLVPWLAIAVAVAMIFTGRIPIQQRRQLACLLIAFGLSTLFCMNFSGTTFYRAFFAVPGFGALRSVDRVINTQIMFFILIFVYTMALIPQRRWSLIAITLIVPFVVVLDNRIEAGLVKSFDKWMARDMVNEVEMQLTAQMDGDYEALAYTPVLSVIDEERVHDRVIAINLTAMLAAQQIGKPIVNAYTGSYPYHYLDFFDHLDQRSLQRWCTDNGIDCSRIQPINDLLIPYDRSDTIVLQAGNGMYVCANSTRNEFLIADRPAPLLWETYRAIYFSDGRVALRAHNGNFVCAELERSKEISATAPRMGDHALFQVEAYSDGVALRAYNGLYLTVDPGTLEIFATEGSPGPLSKFHLQSLADMRSRPVSSTSIVRPNKGEPIQP